MPQNCMHIPEQLFLAPSGKSQRPYPDQDNGLFQPNARPFNQVLKVLIRSMLITLLRDQVNKLLLQPLNSNQPKVGIISFYGDFGIAMIDTWQMYMGSGLFEFVHIQPACVEPTVVVQYCHHKLFWKISCKMKALITLYGETGRMCLGKAITSKAVHLSPHFLNNVFWPAQLPCAIKEPHYQFIKLYAKPILTTHAPSQDVGISAIHARKMNSYLDHIFLIHHHAVGFFQLLLPHRMQIVHLVRVMMITDISRHHARASHPRPYNRARRNQYGIAVAL